MGVFHIKITEYKLNAVITKARAMYGKSLSREDYNNLLCFNSIGEIENYLKNKTIYSGAFENITSSKNNSDYLSFLIQKFSFNQFVKLCKTEMALGDDLYKIFVTKQEVSQILSCIRNILLKNDDKYLLLLPEFLDKFLEIELYKLGKVTTIFELAEALNFTKYKPIIDKCIKENYKTYIDFEFTFLAFLDNYEFETIKNKYKGKERKEMFELLITHNDTSFIKNIYRLKKYFPSWKTEFLSSTKIENTHFTKSELNSLISASNEDEFLEILKKTKYKRYANMIYATKNPEYVVDLLNNEYYLHSFRFSENQAITLYCYYYLSRQEISNIIHIIQGISLHLDSEIIRSMIISN